MKSLPGRPPPPPACGPEIMIIWFNHDTVTSVHDLHRLLIGDEVERRSRLTVLRDGRLEHLWITPRERS